MRMFAVYGFGPTLLWLGFVLAISFLEASLEFRAPGYLDCKRSQSDELFSGQAFGKHSSVDDETMPGQCR